MIHRTEGGREGERIRKHGMSKDKELYCTHNPQLYIEDRDVKTFEGVAKTAKHFHLHTNRPTDKILPAEGCLSRHRELTVKTTHTFTTRKTAEQSRAHPQISTCRAQLY